MNERDTFNSFNFIGNYSFQRRSVICTNLEKIIEVAGHMVAFLDDKSPKVIPSNHDLGTRRLGGWA